MVYDFNKTFGCSLSRSLNNFSVYPRNGPPAMLPAVDVSGRLEYRGGLYAARTISNIQGCVRKVGLCQLLSPFLRTKKEFSQHTGTSARESESEGERESEPTPGRGRTAHVIDRHERQEKTENCPVRRIGSCGSTHTRSRVFFERLTKYSGQSNGI